MQTKKVGILGGTFDPFHKGHFMLAQTAYEQFSLEEVWILPNGNPPHKSKQKPAPFYDRCEMIQKAIEKISYMKLCTEESSSGVYHYTYETLEAFHRKYPQTEFYFLIGADSLESFPNWKNPEKIVRLCTLLVACREGQGKQELEKTASKVQKMYGGRILILDFPQFDVSSKEIRERIQNRESAEVYLEKNVYEYILTEGLYQKEVPKHV